MSTRFDFFPVELQLRIISLLPTPDILRMACTGSTLRDAIAASQQLWTQLVFRDSPNMTEAAFTKALNKAARLVTHQQGEPFAAARKHFVSGIQTVLVKDSSQISTFTVQCVLWPNILSATFRNCTFIRVQRLAMVLFESVGISWIPPASGESTTIPYFNSEQRLEDHATNAGSDRMRLRCSQRFKLLHANSENLPLRRWILSDVNIKQKRKVFGTFPLGLAQLSLWFGFRAICLVAA
ncbi:hypothetical protein M427DRAFT_46530 [Gonapodya prolifera JEL478]|uniref:F-box domain-containing protein n=1 Tax=Gonapodya prolifera (strain JEL478) TaxID=1344416 RepID=A0A139A5T3_GONPJ|nr:hypothetical protein M427DRAFT_46530 [Gonapodya prolifera JEL478]|eukprot:KXS12101.1 hypothetical protein M427DRAFT_46530 [Gonapodya prolifera JEL478]